MRVGVGLAQLACSGLAGVLLAAARAPLSRLSPPQTRRRRQRRRQQTQKPRTAAQAHMGVLGPALHAEVGDTLILILKNNAPFPINAEPGGMLFEPPVAVQPGENVTYKWVRALGGGGLAFSWSRQLSAAWSVTDTQPTLNRHSSPLTGGASPRPPAPATTTSPPRASGSTAPPPTSSPTRRRGWRGRSWSRGAAPWGTMASRPTLTRRSSSCCRRVFGGWGLGEGLVCCKEILIVTVLT
jgi:hypothetical protein